MPIVPALRRWKLEDLMMEANLGYIARLSLKNKQKIPKKMLVILLPVELLTFPLKHP
jgi:hypothetical protein